MVRRGMGRWALIVGVLVGACAGETKAPEAESTRQVAPTWKVKCHRGASSEAPENTRAALLRCFEIGANATEIDVRLSADGVPVMVHDKDTERVAGVDKKVSEQSWAELQKLDVGAWRGKRFVGERIQSLEQVLQYVPKDVLLFVEIKDGVRAVAPVLEVIASAPNKKVAIESFHVDVLERVRSLAPKLPTHLTLGATRDLDGRFLPLDKRHIPRATSLGVTGLSVDRRGLSREFARAAKAAGLQLGVWTVNSKGAAAGLGGYSIDWLETDRPRLFVSQ